MRHHRHDSPFVTIVLCGGYVEVEGAVPAVCARDMLVIHEAGEEHADHFSADTRCLNVELPGLNGVSRTRGALALDDPNLRSAVESVVRSYYRRSSELVTTIERLQSALLDAGTARPQSTPRWLERVLEVFPWASPVPLREAAAMAGLHETHFSRAFRRHLGMTAHEYRARARLRLASALLLTTTTSLARVALGAGFSDQSHLTRAFSEKLGLAPAGYRRTFAR